MSNYKPVVVYESREHLELAWLSNKLDHEHLYRVLDIGVLYRLDSTESGFVEVDDPESPENDNFLIWWMDNVYLGVNKVLVESTLSWESVPAVPALPGHVRLIVDAISSDSVTFDGSLHIPITLRNRIDPNHVDDVVDSQSLKALLYNQFIGIPFEVVHYDKIKHYAGLITTMDLSPPDLCGLRETLAN